MKIISKVEDIHVHLDGPERVLERGLKRAIHDTSYIFGIDDCGHSSKVKDWERSCCSVVVEFDKLRMSGGMCGGSVTVFFKAWCEKHEEDYMGVSYFPFTSRRTEDDGPTDSDCINRDTDKQKECADSGCGFCRAAESS